MRESFNKKLATALALFSVLPVLVFAQLAPGNPITGEEVKTFLEQLGNFLIFVGIAGAVITMVVSGIMYFTSGFKGDTKKAKEVFKNAVIGILIILASGVIINTIDVIIRREFFQ